MRKLILKAKNDNWGLKGPGSWDHSVWKVYDDGSYTLIIKYRPDYEEKPKKEKYNGMFNEDNFSRLKSLAEEPWPEASFVNACDGDAWEFAVYDTQGREVKSFDCGYIYGIEKLEEIVGLLRDMEKEEERNSM